MTAKSPTKEPGKERIAKRIAASGLCSRRDAERWIEAGRVMVDGQVITSPALDVTPDQEILVDGNPLARSQKPRLWGHYKPAGIITTHKDPQGRPTVFDQLPSHMPRVISVGRLDLNSEGLILLTTDSAMARHAELPTTGWPRCYRVRVFGELDMQALQDLRKGITIEGIRYDRIDVELDRQTGRNSWLFVKLYEGKNREIRRVLNHLGLHVNRLIRVAYGPFSLDNREPGDLWEIDFKEFARHFPHLEQKTQSPPKKTLSLNPKKKPHAPHRRKI